MPLRVKLEQAKEVLINDRRLPRSSRIGKGAPGVKTMCGLSCTARNGDRFGPMRLIFLKNGTKRPLTNGLWLCLLRFGRSFLEELKEILRLLKKEAGRETMSLQHIKFFALLPNEHGQAWLELLAPLTS